MCYFFVFKSRDCCQQVWLIDTFDSRGKHLQQSGVSQAFSVAYSLLEKEKQLLGTRNCVRRWRKTHSSNFYCARFMTRNMRRQLVPSRSSQSSGEDGYLIRGTVVVLLVTHWDKLGRFKKKTMPGDSDLIVLGCGLSLRTFKSSPGNCNCIRVKCVRAAKMWKCNNICTEMRVQWRGT